MNFEEVVMKRYATKSFDGKMIDETKVNKLLELIRYSASSFNLQPWKVKIVKDRQTKEKLSPLSWNQPQITTCSHLLIFCAETEVKELIDKLEKQMLAAGAEKEKIANYIKMMRDFEAGMTPEQRLIWAQKQAYIALGNAINGAKALGFDSCPMEGFDPKGYARELGLPAHIVPTVVCPIGFANDKPMAKMRFDAKDIIA
ncbi:NAD(P)H-dependent oxidoreductase [Candidatus Micrarchaeota archaeon]|nr:NAD(P)H-dependent oxidoreductase [Candidatus Micrarchaeota archaeon]